MEPKVRPRPVPLFCKSTRPISARPKAIWKTVIVCDMKLLYTKVKYLVLKEPIDEVESESEHYGGDYKSSKDREVDWWDNKEREI